MNTHHNRHAQVLRVDVAQGVCSVACDSDRGWEAGIRDADVEGFGDLVFVSIRCMVVIKRTLRAPVSPLETTRPLRE